jgi:glutamyl-tRNA(Gln) amidotransferase subunit D
MDLKELLQKNRLSEGDFARVLCKDNSIIEGSIVPSSEKGILALKLKNGYNAGVKIDEVSEIKKVPEGKSVGKPPLKEIKKDPKKPTITILHTGGTIASRVDYRTGAVFSSFNPEDLLSMFPELKEIANFEPRLLAKMWSDDLRFKHFGFIANEIKKEFEKKAEGVIIGMGTDNLAVASAALAFVLEKCPIPVIIVGAQRSSDRGSSDAAMNLICAAEFIAKTEFAGVAICMHYSSSDRKCAILPACKTKKLHSSRRDAFKPVNDSPIALVDYNSKSIEFLKNDYTRKDKTAEMLVKPKFEEKVAIFKIHINMFPEQFEFYEKQGYNGLVIEGTGLGHTPGHNPNEFTRIHEKFFPAIKKLADSGCVIVMTTNALFGRVNMNVYDKGIDLQKCGIISGEDMLAETAFIKLAWLLGNFPKSKVKELIGKNLRGEITERTEIDAFPIEFEK